MSTSRNLPIFAQGPLAELVARSKDKPESAGKVMAGYRVKGTGEFLPLGEVDVTDASFDELCRQCGNDPVQVALLGQAMAAGRQAAQASIASRPERLAFARGYLEIMLKANPMDRAQAILREAVAAKGWPVDEADEVVQEVSARAQVAAAKPASAAPRTPPARDPMSVTKPASSSPRVAVATGGVRRGSPIPESPFGARVKVAGRDWEDLTSVEKHNLAHQDPAAYLALREDYEARRR